MAEPVGFSVSVEGNARVAAKLYESEGVSRPLLILAHGAGAGQSSRFMVEVASALAARGLHVVTFDFPYVEARRRVPDRPNVLEATWRAVLSTVMARPDLAGLPVFAGGKSMGGRIASQVAAEGWSDRLAGLVFFGYPLHPPGQPDKRRDRHLPDVTCPMLFVQGERDAFGNAGEIRGLVATLPRAELYLVAGADHSLATPKRGAAPDRASVFAAIEDHVAGWIDLVVEMRSRRK